MVPKPLLENNLKIICHVSIDPTAGVQFCRTYIFIKMCIINWIADSNEPLEHLRYIMSISLHTRLPGVQQAGFEHERCHRCPRLNFKLLVILRSMEFENNDVSMVIMDLYLNAKCFQYLRTNCSNQCKLRMLPREIILGSGPCKEANWANHSDNLWSWTRITCTKKMSLPTASVSVIDSEMWKWLIDHWLWFTNDSSDTNFPLLNAQNMLLIQFDVINRSLVRRLKQFNLEDSWAANSPCYYHIAKACIQCLQNSTNQIAGNFQLYQVDHLSCASTNLAILLHLSFQKENPRCWHLQL